MDCAGDVATGRPRYELARAVIISYYNRVARVAGNIGAPEFRSQPKPRSRFGLVAPLPAVRSPAAVVFTAG